MALRNDTAQPISKFHKQCDLQAKKVLRILRLDKHMDMKSGAAALGISVKQLEDFETTRNYGAYVTVEIIHKACRIYNVWPTAFFIGK